MNETATPPPITRYRRRVPDAGALTAAAARLGILGWAQTQPGGATPARPLVGPRTDAQSILRIIAGTAAMTLLVILVTWAVGGFTGLSGAGDVALIFGITVTLALGIGLMALVFYSSRSEQDELVQQATTMAAISATAPGQAPLGANATETPRPVRRA
jgi:hypothetical protein